ncbi:MAG TPA: aryl-sulfate sulfotransferase [Candidatus Acidoferrum sp.]|nr:aryl-sulfate sulfotransferase [Candidatus Acidoferrum sp.]
MSKHSTWLRSALPTSFILLLSFVFFLAGCSNNYSAPIVSVSPSPLTFPAISQGATSSPSTITVTNSGNAALSISSVSFGGANVADFTNASSCSGPVSPASTCTISITFAPKHSGPLSESVTINDNDKDSPQVVTVSGTANAIVLSLTPPAAAMGVGQTLQFAASGDSNGVTWSVIGVTGGPGAPVPAGTIDASGNYTPPAGSSSFVALVTATSKTDPSKTAGASVNVVAPGVFANTNNVQVAQYSVTLPSPGNVSVQFGLDTNYGLNTWSQPAGTFGGPVSLYVAGMKQSTPYHMRGVLQFADGTSFNDADFTFTTGALPATLVPTITAAITPGMTPQPGVEMIDLVNASIAGKGPESLATDLSGNIIWAYQPSLPGGPVANPIKLLPNGHFLIVFSGVPPDGVNGVVQEVDLGGNVIWQMTSTQLNTALAAASCAECNVTVVGAHHDFQVLPNGHLIVIASTQQTISGTVVTGDVLIDLGDMENVGGNNPNHLPQPVWAWNEFNHLDTNRQPYSYPDWTHTNALLYSLSDGDLIISMRHQNWLVKMDYNNGTGDGHIIWHLGYQGDFTLLNADGTPDTNNHDWFFAQHGPSFLDPTRTSGSFSLAVFDNGDDREVSVAPGDTCGGTLPACYSTVPILDIDETAKTATLTFHPTTHDYTWFGGNAEVLANGNIEYDECAITMNADNAIVYEVTSTPLPQTVWQMVISGQDAYRAMRIPSLYPGVQW